MYKTLLVDDEPYILNGLAQLLNWDEFGIEIIGRCSDGEEALQFLKEHYIHLLITDVHMP